MKKKTKLESTATVSYIIVSVLFVLVFLYMAFFEKANIYEVRDSGELTTVENYSVREIADPEAPVGIRREYSWVLDDIDTNENCLGFYLVHNYAEVYFGDELMYSITPDEGNIICNSVSSNWVLVPMYPEDSGKEVRVIVTPAYESVSEFNVEFEVGSRYAIYTSRLKLDMPQIILAVLCILSGAFVMIVQLLLIFKKKIQAWDIFYLGNFSAILGVWKITDTRFSAFMFEGNTLVLGYITIGMLFLATIPILFFVREHYFERKNTLITVVSIICCGTALCALLCQMFGIAEFKQTLTLSHILIILSVLTLVVTSAMNRRRKKAKRAKVNLFIVLLLIPGIIADLICYYFRRSSSGVFFTMAAFLIYSVVLFVSNILIIAKRANTDAQTGLFNKSRWEQLMSDKNPVTGPIGIMMLDLNRLKYTNDTMGHEAGDKMIFTFSNILRNSVPHSNIICRWGGDEFTVMVTDATQETMELYLSEIKTAAERYNESGEKPEIHFAAGYALSSQFPDLTLKELFKKADERMYQDKKLWYKENLNTAY